jgi:hypothetical protein
MGIDRKVSLYLIFTYPPEYPEVIPELSLEPIDEDSGELSEEEEEDVLTQLRVMVSVITARFLQQL